MNENNVENSRINPEVIVIGAGMVGSMITKVLRASGVKVFLIDSKKDFSGSKCSSGMWRDGWISDKIRERYEEGIDILHEFAGIEFIDCENLDPLPAKAKKKVDDVVRIDELMYVDWRNICNVDSDKLEVISVENNVVTCFQEYNGQENQKLEAKFSAKYGVFICAGAYTDQILQNSGYNPIGIDRYFGTAIEMSDVKTNISKIKTWAPYKQFLAAKISKSVIKFSDGSMVKNPPLDKGDERCDKVHERLKLHISEVMGKKYQLRSDRRELLGLRPYMPSKYEGDFINKHDDRLYSCTGTAKNTTILCGYIAKKVNEIVSDKKSVERRNTKVKR